MINLAKTVETHQEFKDLLFAYPDLNTKPPLDAILQVPDLSLIEFDYLFETKKYLEAIHQSFVVKKPTYESTEIEEISHDLNDADFEHFVKALETATAHIPNKFKTSFSIKVSYKINSGFDHQSNEIFIKFNPNLSHLVAEIGHEIGHLIESKRIDLFEKSNDFVQSRKISPKLYDYQEYCRENLLDLITDPVPLYMGRFVDPYVGRVYQNLHLTEVISVGIQFYLLDPATFLIKDPEHYAIIEEILCH